MRAHNPQNLNYSFHEKASLTRILFLLLEAIHAIGILSAYNFVFPANPALRSFEHQFALSVYITESILHQVPGYVDPHQQVWIRRNSLYDFNEW
jgi:hypothetical protein